MINSLVAKVAKFKSRRAKKKANFYWEKKTLMYFIFQDILKYDSTIGST